MIRPNQKKYVAVNADGDVVGPIGDTEEFVRQAFIIGYKRAAGAEAESDAAIWEKIQRIGYSIGRVKLVEISDGD